MANLGYATFDEMIGQIKSLDRDNAIDHWKARGLDFSRLFFDPPVKLGDTLFQSKTQDHHIDKVLDRELIRLAEAAIISKKPVKLDMKISNRNRSIGAMLSGEVSSRYGYEGLPEDTINVKFSGTTGQSFGAWLSKGITLEVEGEANDYVGKGLSGGKIIIILRRRR